MNGVSWIDEKVLIPDLLGGAPQTRPVLDRYGLRGCGGEHGPVESLGFFAKAHDVPLERLLGELRAAADADAIGVSTPEPVRWTADTIYRPFFKSGILVVLTLGATWGAYLLWGIARQGAFEAAGIHDVNAHGHAQIFGWVGLFVMGFAYQAFPRFKHTDLAYPRLAYTTLALMLVGLLGRSCFEPFVTEHGWAVWPALTGSVLEVVAVALCVAIVGQTLRRAGKPLAVYDYYILSALFWFVVQAVYEGVYFAATVSATDRHDLQRLIATWQGPLREIQIHGFALLMILGVSQRVFHHFYGLPAPRPGLSRAVLVILNLCVIGETTGLVAMQIVGHSWALLWYASVLMLAGSVGVLVWNWHIFSHPEESDRTLKFLRVAYVWLFISLGMLVLVPAYQFGLLSWAAPSSAAAHLGFSHAYYGAIRHAITVGFISLMIVGVAAKVVPTLNGVNVHALSGLWGPFLLINTGCLLRVSTQTLTDFTPIGFQIVGFSGVLETIGLAWWGIHLWGIMAGRIASAGGGERTPYVAGTAVVASNVVADVLDHRPDTLTIFLAFGFRPLANPLLRRTLARRTTIAQACQLLGVDATKLLDAINADPPQAAARRSLAVVQASIPGVACDSARPASGSDAPRGVSGGSSTRPGEGP